MSTHNIGFYEEISKIIPLLSSNIISNTHLISSPANSFDHRNRTFGLHKVTSQTKVKKYCYLLKMSLNIHSKMKKRQ